jgi:hypothetical protein
MGAVWNSHQLVAITMMAAGVAGLAAMVLWLTFAIDEKIYGIWASSQPKPQRDAWRTDASALIVSAAASEPRDPLLNLLKRRTEHNENQQKGEASIDIAVHNVKDNLLHLSG